MEFIEPSYEIIDKLDGSAIIKKIELCGRVCYKSEKRITEDSAEKYVKTLIKSGHESVLEHASFSVRFTVSRAIANEIVRHRLASYSQESTRYCNYNGGIQVIIPKAVENDETYKSFCLQSETQYTKMLAEGCRPETARGVLPLDLKTELIMTANLREWRHFFKMRAEKHAHPELRRVTVPLLKELTKKIPAVFSDIPYDEA